MEEKEVSNYLVKLLYINRKYIFILTLIFCFLAIGITFLIPKKYASYGVIYPTKSNSIKEVVRSSDFGFEIQADRLIQLFESDRVKQTIIKEFDLVNYYELDTSSVGWKNSLYKKYAKDISFERTRFLSVAIRANTKNPELSANIVNRLMDLIDIAREEIFKDNANILLADYKKRLIKQEKTVRSLLVRINEKESNSSTNRLSVNSLKHIEERINKGELVGGDEIVKKTLKSNYSINKELLISEYYRELGILNTLKGDINSTEESIKLPFPAVYRIIKAEPNDKKVSPSLINNLILGFLLGLLISILFIVFRDRFKSMMVELKEVN